MFRCSPKNAARRNMECGFYQTVEMSSLFFSVYPRTLHLALETYASQPMWANAFAHIAHILRLMLIRLVSLEPYIDITRWEWKCWRGCVYHKASSAHSPEKSTNRPIPIPLRVVIIWSKIWCHKYWYHHLFWFIPGQEGILSEHLVTHFHNRS